MATNYSLSTHINNLTNKFGNFSGFGIYWRMFGKSKPYYTERKSIEEYTQYHNNNHIKSFIDPKTINYFPDPHFPSINGKYIDELGRSVVSPIGEHTSNTIWIKHIWTRSLSEFEFKIKRGDANKVIRIIVNQDFITYNDKCIITE
jgi:hypothetical protein